MSTREQQIYRLIAAWGVDDDEELFALIHLINRIRARAIKTERNKKVAELLDAMTEDERLDAFGPYCRHCGRKDVRCRCWDDS